MCCAPAGWLRRMIQFKEKSASQVNILPCTLAKASCPAEAPTALLAPPPACLRAPYKCSDAMQCAGKVSGPFAWADGLCLTVRAWIPSGSA